MAQNDHETVDMLLVGAGIMSATLAVLLKELDPNLKMEVVEPRSPARSKAPTRGTTRAPATPACAS